MCAGRVTRRSSRDEISCAPRPRQILITIKGETRVVFPPRKRENRVTSHWYNNNNNNCRTALTKVYSNDAKSSTLDTRVFWHVASSIPVADRSGNLPPAINTRCPPVEPPSCRFNDTAVNEKKFRPVQPISVSSALTFDQITRHY